MINESTIEMSDLGGCLGLISFDHNPQTTPGRVRPFIWAYLLLRGAVRRSEVAAALAGHVAADDERIWDDPLDRSPLEATIDDALADMVRADLLRVNGDLYVLTPAALKKTLSVTCTLDASLPDHLVLDTAHG